MLLLDEYSKKRVFSKTREPKPEKKIRNQNNKPVYVIQKHTARKLHYDLRLEIDGVLKSWAIPKEPPTEANIKRLAIQTEDHPLTYAGFEGEIPEGLYGAGTVEIWDKGYCEFKETWENKIIFSTHETKKLKGTFCLIKTRMDSKNWLFFKKKN